MRCNRVGKPIFIDRRINDEVNLPDGFILELGKSVFTPIIH
jgi:hypothetical protein